MGGASSTYKEWKNEYKMSEDKPQGKVSLED
jgi:hypothetical protein